MTRRTKKPGRTANNRLEQATLPARTKRRTGRAVALQGASPTRPTGAAKVATDLPPPDVKLEDWPPLAHQVAAIESARERVSKRRARAEVRMTVGEGKLALAPPYADFDGYLLQMLDTFGTTSHQFTHQSIGRLAAVVRRRESTAPTEDELNAAIAAVDGMRPNDEIEAMLAVQMVATHDVAMDMLSRSKMAETLTGARELGALATKLLRAYAAQLEALARFRRGGEQRVIVQHVHVADGGQAAVVGAVEAGPGGVKK